MNDTSKVPLQLVVSGSILAALINRHGAKGRSMEHFAAIALEASACLIEQYNKIAIEYQKAKSTSEPE